MVPTSEFWNLFYLCDATLDGACEKVKNCTNVRFCESEQSEVPPVLWTVWVGSEARLEKLKDRFSVREGQHAFFFCNHTKTIVERVPESETLPITRKVWLRIRL